VLFDYARGYSIGYLHRWRKGNAPSVHPLAQAFGKQVGQMHRLMKEYKGDIVHRNETDFFDDLFSYMRRDNYDKAKIRDFEEYGNELRDMLKNLPVGFYHADMHSGNTKYRNEQFTWMDFDKACMSYRIMDFGWLLETDYVHFHKESLERSRRLFDEVYAGYSTEQTLTDDEIAAIFHSVAVVHYEANVLDIRLNNRPIIPDIMDREHSWLMRWRECCNKLIK